MPLVPTARSDQQNHGARPAPAATEQVALSPHSANTLPAASATVTMPPKFATS